MSLMEKGGLRMPQFGEIDRNYKYLNKSMRRVDSADKVSGHAQYAADLVFPHMLVAGALYSPYASAQVIRIDTEKAEKIPGVAAVMTFKDLKKPASWGYYTYMTDRIRYEADAVAIVAAENNQALKEGLDAIEVEYEELQPVITIEEALAPGAPLVHENDKDCVGNIWSHATTLVRKGDVDEAFPKCDKIIERSYSTSWQEHMYFEPEAAVAVPDPCGSITAYAGCANPFFGRRWVADSCDLPRPKARLIQTVVGGAFGGKEELLGVVIGRACMLAQKTGRPVKYVTSREESIKGSTKRHPFRLEYKVGVNNDGHLQAVQCRITETCGAYHMHEFMNFRAKVHAVGVYNIPNVKVDIQGVFTNTVTSGAMRGYSAPQTIFAVEQLYEDVAQEINMDPLEFKKMNILKQGDIHPCGQEMKQEIILPEMIDKICEKTDYIRKRDEYAKQTGTIRKGIGLSIFHRGCGLGGESPDNSACMVAVHDDGTVMANVGLGENGQGLRTAYTQILAEAMDVDPSLIYINQVDTNAIVDSGITAASRGTVMGAQSVRKAGEELKGLLMQTAAMMFKAPVEMVILEDGFFKLKGVPDAMIPWQAVCECHHWTGGQDGVMAWFSAPYLHFDNEKGYGDGFPTYTYSAVVTELEVDTETGDIKVEKVTSAHDCGNIINPRNLTAQIHGGVTMGMGFAVMEDLDNEKGHIRHANMDTYMIPSSLDTPEFEPLLFECSDPTGTYGSKSIGEPSLEGVPASIVLALRNALQIEIRHIPVNKVTLYELLHKNRRDAQ